jgi:hypothetical protein
MLSLPPLRGFISYVTALVRIVADHPRWLERSGIFFQIMIDRAYDIAFEKCRC